ncbi:SUMO-activating enzyme subunit 1-like [Limulus polyphemus]|uniref:SUMO-activating enzyme subunit 1 n=1 Tax=Limulus polyphemus TaxID=6850 RepID=A0ABM1SYR0_LIMPO|nr:SUMO-activating enzyme subunit 1-like [Limulus polyphemus]XP_022248766.1 SUMO-activating enzyme subunit 1-like [Limulus polyphemus]
MVENEFTAEEAALYDRQIRLWGLDAQKRLRAAKVLIAGLGGLGAEVTKNLVLAGIHSVTLLDHHNVSELDYTSQFLLSREDLGKNRAESSLSHTQQLNPRVNVVVDKDSIQDKGEEFFKTFDVVCLTGYYSLDVLFFINNTCRKHNIKFYCGGVWGFFGYVFTDLGKQHTFVEEIPVKIEQPVYGESGEPMPKKPRSEEKTTQMVKKTVEFVPLEKALAVKSGKAGVGIDRRTSSIFLLTHVLFRFLSNHKRPPLPQNRTTDTAELIKLRDETLDDLGVDRTRLGDVFLDKTFGELSPICAVVGGVLSQDIIKAVSAKDAPLKNFFLFDGQDGSGVVEHFGR